MKGYVCTTSEAPINGETQGDGRFCSARPPHFHRRSADGYENARPSWEAPASSPNGAVGVVERGRQPRVALTPTIMSAGDLAALQFPELKVIVEHLLVEGAMLVVAPGKSGKSRLMWNIAVAVAAGGVALGGIRVEPGDVLYLSLEDGKRRSRQRMLQASDGTPPDRLSVATEWPKLDAGGRLMLEAWLQQHEAARLIVVDTFKRIRPGSDPRRNAYDVDYEAISPLNDLAIQYRVGIAILHHTNKLRASEDPTDKISGSTGLLAGVDGVIVLERVRGKADALLGVYHRDFEDAQYAIKSDPDMGWRWLGDAAEYTRTELQDEIIRTILDAGRPLQPADVATAMGRDRNQIKQRLWQMAQPSAGGEQLLVAIRGHYWPANKPLPDSQA